jgi:hypothetical protein
MNELMPIMSAPVARAAVPAVRDHTDAAEQSMFFPPIPFPPFADDDAE